MAKSKEDTTKARIIKHMNDDHSDSISLYLQHYCQLTPQAALGASIHEISVSSMSLKTVDSKMYTIPFQPPMKSLADMRERMVEMDRIVRKALGISNIRLTKYLPPTSPLHVSIFGICLFTFFTFALAKNGNVIVPGTYYHDKILPWFPGGPDKFLSTAQKITLPVISIHAVEAWYLDYSRLRRYGVERGTRLWWYWILSCFIEGFGSFQRVDAEVKKALTRAEKAKH